LISLGDHFTDVPIISKFDGQISYSDTPDVMNLSMSTTSDLKPHLQHLMSRAISIEESARNIQRLLWCTVALLLQMERRDGMPSTEGDIRFATFVIQEIIRLSKRKWSADVNLVAYAALSSLTYGYKHLDASRLETARSVVVALAETIMENVNKTVNEWEREDNDRLLQRSFITMTDWFMVDPEFTASIDQASYAVLLKSIVTALGGVVATGVRPATPAPSIRAAASFALNILLYRSANFPTLSGPHRVSSEISEEDVLAQINPDPEIAKQHMRYFALDGSIILTLIDVPNPGGSMSFDVFPLLSFRNLCPVMQSPTLSYLYVTLLEDINGHQNFGCTTSLIWPQSTHRRILSSTAHLPSPSPPTRIYSIVTWSSLSILISSIIFRLYGRGDTTKIALPPMSRPMSTMRSNSWLKNRGDLTRTSSSGFLL
jgi:hypothetical protein